MEWRRQAIAEAARKKHEGPSLAEAVSHEEGTSLCQPIGAFCANNVLFSGTTGASPTLITTTSLRFEMF